MSTQSINFDGTNECVVVGDHTELAFEVDDAFTIAGWVKWTETGEQVIASKVDNGTGYGYELIVSDGSPRFRLLSSSGDLFVSAGLLVTNAMRNGQWHWIGATYDGSEAAAGIALYFDDRIVVPYVITDDTIATIVNTGDFTIGARDAGAALPLSGMIDDVVVYDKALTTAEMATVYGGGTPPDLTSVGPTGNLVGLWEMGDGDTYPTITDQSASGNDGTMTNMAAADIVNDAPGGDPFATTAGSTLFGGTDEHMVIGDVSELDFERTDSFTIVGWFKNASVSANEVVFSKREGSGNFRGYSVYLTSTGALAVVLCNVNSSNELRMATTATGFDDDGWHHFVVTYDGSSTPGGVGIWIDGVDEALTTVTSSPLSATIQSTATAKAGALSSSLELFTGYLAEIGVYSRVITDSEAFRAYSRASVVTLTAWGPTKYLVGYWTLRDGGSFPTITDLSESGNDGTLTNMESTDVVSDESPVHLSLLLPTAASMAPITVSARATNNVLYYKMRGLDDGASFFTWVVAHGPDYAGANIVDPQPALVGSFTPGSAVIVTRWTTDG